MEWIGLIEDKECRQRRCTLLTYIVTICIRDKRRIYLTYWTLIKQVLSTSRGCKRAEIIFHRNFIALLYFSRQMLEGLKKIDAFPKAFDDFRVKTTTGALGMQRTFLFCLPRFVLTQSISRFLSFHYLNNHYGDLIFLWDVLLSEDGKRFSILFSTPSRTHFTEIFRKRLTTCTLTEHGPTSSM